MQRIGITGQNGFIGKHLYNTLKIAPDKYELIPFERNYFDNEEILDKFVAGCDVIVHMAGVNRDPDPAIIYATNIGLTNKLIASFERTGKKPYVIFTSSTQEEKDNLYGKSKQQSRLAFQEWAKRHQAQFSGLVIPNVYGPFCIPFYNSVVATFSHQLILDQTPVIDKDAELRLIYVGELVTYIINAIENRNVGEVVQIKETTIVKVSEILETLWKFKQTYFIQGAIPELKSIFHLNLFNTFRSYIDLNKRYPVKFKTNVDNRGGFTEIVRLETKMGGQLSFSTTIPGVTRGNHFHTRKIERFAVIKGEALIQLRKVGDDKVYNFYLSGNEPSYVDMPIWTLHNIKNIGTEDLYTIFWINELFNPEDPDTYFEVV